MIKKREDAGTKHFDDSNAFIESSNTMDDVYGNVDDYNPKWKRKVLIVFDDRIADIMSNKKFQAIIKELYIRCRKLSTYLVFITRLIQIQHIIWLWKLTTRENYKILSSIILQILITNIL